MTTPAFRHKLEDLLYYIIRYTDGTTAKFIYRDGVVGVTALSRVESSSSSNQPPQKHTHIQHLPYALKDFCRHEVEAGKVLYTAPDRDLTLTVADMVGVLRASRSDTPPTWIIDCGGVISPPFRLQGRMLNGDAAMVSALRPYLTVKDEIEDPPAYQLLKINWFDRRAPDLTPAFWPALVDRLSGDVVINCQGGHGRSGTAFASLLMCLVPDYTPLDAIIHLRALHCPRAIESVEQHEYLNSVGQYLGRVANAHEAEKVTNFKATFNDSRLPEAVRMREWLAQGVVTATSSSQGVQG